MKDIKALMGKKKSLSPIETKAKTNVLESLKNSMQDLMGEKVSGLKKVTVASNDKEGLKAGLDKAKNLLGNHESADVEGAEEDLGEDLDHDQEEGESEEHKAKVLGLSDEEESPEEEASETPSEEMSEDELDQKIQELLKKKAALKK
jgi:hypothetical protein